MLPSRVIASLSSGFYNFAIARHEFLKLEETILKKFKTNRYVSVLISIIALIIMLWWDVEPALAQRVCAADIYETSAISLASTRRARERRAKRRAIRKWERAVEGRSIGANGEEIPELGTDFSNIKDAEIVSFNCSGRPLKCVLRAIPCVSPEE